jgi:hypothetical protein
MAKKSRHGLKNNSPEINSDLLEKMGALVADLTGTEDVETVEPEAINHLAKELDTHPVLVEGLFGKILSQPTQGLARLLFVLLDRVKARPVQKGIKRTLYLLEQKGVTLPDIQEEKKVPKGRGVLKALDEVRVTAYLSEYDPARNRMLAMLIPKAPAGKIFMFALIEPEGHLGSLTALEVSKKGAKEILTDLADQSGHSFLEADPGQVAYLLKEAHDRKSGLSPDDEGIYAAILSYLSGLKTMAPCPIIRNFFPVVEEGGKVFGDMTRLLGIPEVHYYQLPEEWIKPYQKAIQDVQGGILILSQSQKREQIWDIIRRARREIFQDPAKSDLLRYLEELSYLYYLRGRMEEAEILFSAARSVMEGKDRDLENNPLLLWLMERALLGELGDDSQADPSDQVEEQSEGGIIIPPWVKK